MTIIVSFKLSHMWELRVQNSDQYGIIYGTNKFKAINFQINL